MTDLSAINIFIAYFLLKIHWIHDFRFFDLFGKKFRILQMKEIQLHFSTEHILFLVELSLEFSHHLDYIY